MTCPEGYKKNPYQPGNPDDGRDDTKELHTEETLQKFQKNRVIVIHKCCEDSTAEKGPRASIEMTSISEEFR